MRKIVSFFGDSSDIFDRLNERAGKYAAEKGFDYIWAPQNPYSQEDVIRHLKEADMGIIDVQTYDAEIFKEIHETTPLLVRFGVGYDKVNLTEASEYGIAIARTTGANTVAVAEMALSLMLAARRQFTMNRSCMDSGVWVKNVANETVGSTVGVLGFGYIGRTFAKLAKGIGCRVIVYDPFASKEKAEEEGVELVDLDTLFETADAISVHVPYGPETHHLVDAKRLAQMKPSAVIVNTARGNIIDEEALYHALAEGKIRGAGLDVFGQEPLSTDSPLLQLDNIVLTPHLSGQTEESLWNTYAMAIDIAADFFQGKHIPHILNPDYNQKKK